MNHTARELCRQARLVIFDLDGTLVDSVPDLHLALSKARTELHLPPCSEQQVSHWVGNGAKLLVDRALADPALGLSETEQEQHRDQALRLFFKHYETSNGQTSRCYSGAVELLAELQVRGVSTAIVTNKPAQFTKTLLLQLGLKVDLVLSGDSLAEKKPSPMPLNHCLQHFSLKPQDAIMIGDSVSDLSSARAAGMKMIAVSYGYNHGQAIADFEPDAMIDSLDELR